MTPSPGTLRSYAKILRMPRTVIAQTADGRPTRCTVVPGEITLAAANALEFQADSIERATEKAADAPLQTSVSDSSQVELTHGAAS